MIIFAKRFLAPFKTLRCKALLIIKIIVSIIASIIIFSCNAFVYAAENPFPLQPDIGSASHSEGPYRPVLNPAFCDVPGSSLLAYKYIFYDGETSGNHFARLGLYGFSFMYGRYENIYRWDTGKMEHPRTDYFQFSKGFFIKEIFGLGASFQFSRSDNRRYKGYSSWSFGILLRPIKYLSVGLTLSDLWAVVNSQNIGWKETYSISVRPYREWVTLSFDLIRKRGETIKDINYRVRADLKLMYGLSAFLRFDRNLDILFGVTVPMTFRSFPGTGFLIDYQRSNSRKSAQDYNSFGIAFTFKKPGSAVEIPAGMNILKIRIGGLKEIEKRSFFGKERMVFYDLVNAIRMAGRDSTIDGFLLEIDKVTLGFAQIQELRDELKKARTRGRKVYSIITSPGNKGYYLASVSDKIYFTPNSPFYIRGLFGRVYFIKGLMDKIGVKFESVKRGKFKSYNEKFTRKHMSRELRENLTSLVKSLNDQFLGDIMNDRGIERDVIDKIFKKGIMKPEEAVLNNFVDAVKYPNEALKDISKNASYVSLHKYMKEKRVDTVWGPIPEIAVVNVSGSIVRGKAFRTGMCSAIGDETYIRIMEEVFSDRMVKAVVIRVSSGGGSAAASDFMWEALVRLKRKYDKPVVFSFGNIAASGGYYIACTGDKIYSDRGTVTGSIGVVYGKLSLQELYKKIGINKDIIKMDEFADIFSESRDLAPKEKKIFQKAVNFYYDSFTGKVIQSRKINSKMIKDVAEGRVFTGQQAKKNRLIDEIGGIVTAIEYARKLSNLDERYRIKKFPDKRGGILSLFNLPEFNFLKKQVGTLIKNAEFLNFKDEGALYFYPYRIEIE